MAGDGRLHVAQLDPVSADFHLAVSPAYQSQFSWLDETGQIACLVNTSLVERTGEKARSSKLGAIVITTR